MVGSTLGPRTGWGHKEAPVRLTDMYKHGGTGGGGATGTPEPEGPVTGYVKHVQHTTSSR